MSNLITVPPIRMPVAKPLVRPYPRPIITDPLVEVYYVFDREGVITDLSGKGNHGVINGPTWSAKGRYGSALSFDGLDDYVTVGTESNFDFGANQDFSFWMWFYPNVAADTRFLYIKNVAYLAAWILNNDKIIAKIDDDVTAKSITTTNTVNEGEWNFYCSTHDRDGNLSVYLNADAANTVDISSVGDINNNTDMRIGNPTESFDGQMDIFGCIKRVLTAIEIRNLYKSGL